MNERIDVHQVFAKHFRKAPETDEKGGEAEPTQQVDKGGKNGFRDVAALAYAVSKTLAEGSICLDTESYVDEMEGLSELDQQAENPFWEDKEHFKQQLEESAYAGKTPGAHKPFIIDAGNAYLHRYFHYETRITKHIGRLGSHFQVITGGPGTGKTYGLGERLVDLLAEHPDINLAMAAPTGKAAARMNEAIGKYLGDKHNSIPNEIREKLESVKAQTLHKLLGSKHKSVFFRHDNENPLPNDLVVVDEASMVDGALMAKLMDAIGDGTRLFLVGDKDQLASVEAGSVFGDICRASDSELLKDKVEVKDKIWRTKGKKLIPFSKSVIAGDATLPAEYENNEEVTIDKEYDEGLFKKKAMIYKDYIKEEDIGKALQELNKVRFLCVTREHDQSVAETNARIEKLLRKEIGDASIFSPAQGFYHNQPIIITQNDYDLDLRNGDVGLIRRDENGDLQAYFESTGGKEPRKVKAGYLNSYETVFAMTIHKSQGSEFDEVVVILPEKRAKKLLTRELLYTGVTRASESVLIQSPEDVLKECITGEVSRASGITERIKKLSHE